MLTKGSISNPGGGIGDGVASSTIIGGFSSVFASVPGTSGYAGVTNNNIMANMDEFLGLTGGSSTIGDPISTLRPQLNDMELRRRARNNAILAKIQELEANACVQAARSERLRMMRTEYESLVRKYASSGKSRWGTTSNGHLNENNNNNGFPSSRYLLPFNSPQPQQSSYISLKESDPPPPTLRLSTTTTTQPLLTTTTNTHPFISSAHPTRDIPSNIYPSFATTGVNTDISGPVKPVLLVVSDNANDLQQRVLNLERRKVTAIIDSSSQTEAVKLQGKTLETEDPQQQQHQQVAMQVGTTVAAVVQYDGPQASSPSALLLPSASSSGPIILDGERTTKANQATIVMNGDNSELKEPALFFSKERKSVPNKVEMMLMMLDEEDDESSYQEEQVRRKQQFENLHEQLNHQKPNKSQLQDDTNSIISSPPSTSAAEGVSTSNATDEIRFKRQRQQQRQMEKVVADHERKYQKKGNPSKDKMNEETSQDTTTISLANKNNKSKNKDGNHTDKQVTVAPNAADFSEKIMFHDGDISLSDSTSVFQIRKNESERKKLLQQLAATSAQNSHMKNNRKMDQNGISDRDDENNEKGGNQPEESQSDNDSEEIGKEKFGKRSENKRIGGGGGVADDMHSSPTAGATSESIGDSMMDSIHKTPDALLPRDDSELHEIAEVNEKEHGEMEEIELAHKVSFGVAHNTYADEVDDVLVVTATAVSADIKGQPSGGGGGWGEGTTSKAFRVQSAVNDKVLDERKMRLKQGPAIISTLGGIKELEVYERRINDAEEIRSNNLSSSKVDVPAEEEENFTHANNPAETNAGGITAAATITNSAITLQEKALIQPKKENIMDDEMKEEEEKNPALAFYKDIEHPMDKEMTVQKNSEFLGSQFQEKEQNVSGGDSGSMGTRLNESNKKRSMISHSSAPSANMSAHSSTTSSFTSESNAVENVVANTALFPPSVPASTNHPQRDFSTGSSSTSSSRQHSLDDQVDESEAIAMNSNNISQTKEQSSSGSHHGSPQMKKIQHQQHQKSPTLPQSVHKRHQQLQQQVRKEREEKEITPPVGADAMPERLSTSSDSFSSNKSPVLEAGTAPPTQVTNASVDINNGRKVSLLEKGGVASVKTTKGSPVLGTVPTLTLSPSSSSFKKIGSTNNQASSSNGNNNVSGNGNGGHATVTRPASGGKSTAKNPGMTMKQAQSSIAVTIPSGPTGGQNTARRLKLKLHDDSDTDSSEIGSVKSTPLIKGSVSGNQGNASSGSGHQSYGNNGGSNTKNAEGQNVSSAKNTTEKKFTEEVDDDFDDFYDNF